MKDDLPDLSNCLAKSDMFFEGDPTNEIRIHYNSTPTDSYNHKNNIFIGGKYDGVEMSNNYNNIIIGYNENNSNYKKCTHWK
jgi:hypothetical protein